MAQTLESLVVSLGVDVSDYRSGFAEAERIGARFASSLGSAFDDVAFRGKTLSEAISGLALGLSRSTLRAASGSVGNVLTDGLTSLFRSGPGGGGSSAGILPFARGGVFGHPTLASLGGPRLGVIGEAGPEAVLPLTRGEDGRLGVRGDGGTGGGVTVNFTVSTPDAASFARTETQIAAMLARAVDRGRRGL